MFLESAYRLWCFVAWLGGEEGKENGIEWGGRGGGGGEEVGGGGRLE